MPCRIVSPATVPDAAECVGAVSIETWLVVRHQIAAGASWALRDEADRTLIIGGAFPDGDGLEAWFIPSAIAAKRMIAVTRALRLTMSAAPYRGIRTIVATEAGRRIARAAGFVPAASVQGFEIWERP